MDADEEEGKECVRCVGGANGGGGGGGERGRGEKGNPPPPEPGGFQTLGNPPLPNGQTTLPHSSYLPDLGGRSRLTTGLGGGSPIAGPRSVLRKPRGETAHMIPTPLPSTDRPDMCAVARTFV